MMPGDETRRQPAGENAGRIEREMPAQMIRHDCLLLPLLLLMRLHPRDQVLVNRAQIRPHES